MLNPEYWTQRYKGDNTPWDIGHASPPLINYTNQIEDKALDILIPGAGKAHEAIYLHRAGFRNVLVCDWAEVAFEHLKEQAPDFPEDHMIVADFFELDLEVDLILEQTFFSAIDPKLRKKYVEQCYKLLRPSGKIVGVLFAHEFPFEGPPFGGNKAIYQSLFATHFNILSLEIASDSIAPRLGNELFAVFKKRY